LLLRAFAALLPAAEGLRLRITGSGPTLASLQALAADLKIGSAVSFHPATSDVLGALRELDVFVLPSFSEGLSNSIMEAMASGCAVAASAAGGNVELIEDGVTGLLFDPLRVETLEAALRRLVEDARLRSRLAEAGAEFIEGRFSRSAAARRMESIYAGFLEGLS
jgi:glycosyltransferase involved in cell wall biosynthesis